MHVDDDIDGPRIVRYLTGRSSPEEAGEIRQRLAEDARLAQLIAELTRLWNTAGRTGTEWDVEGAWQHLLAARQAHEATPEAPPAGPERRFALHLPRPARPIWAWRAAAAVVVVGAGVITWLAQRHTPAAPGPLTEVATRPGQRAALRLPDGTRVELNVASKLRYPSTYGSADRDVYLEGEAYFAVTHDERRPFVVHTSRAVARDLGTAFAVRAYPDARAVEVLVVEGAVELHATAPRTTVDRLLLGASDLGRLDRTGQLSVEHDVDAAARLAWREGRLVFRDTPLREALPQLSLWYDADLRLGDTTIAEFPLTATFRGEPLPRVLQLLAAALDLRVEQEGGTTLFYRKPPNRTP